VPPLLSYAGLHLLFVGLVLGWTGFNAALSLRNLRHNEARMRRRGEWLREVIGYEDPEEVITYLRLHAGLGIAAGAYGTLLILGVMYSGLFTRFVRAWAALSLGGPIASGTLLAGGLVLLQELVSLPRSLYEVFVIEERFGFNRLDAAEFFRQRARRLAVTLLLTGTLVAGFLGLIEAFPVRWPIPAMLAIGGVYVILSVLVPNWILPFFYRHRPLQAGPLRKRIAGFLARHDLKVGGRIFVEERSKETRKANAYFAGFGPFKKLVLTDTLLEAFGPEEILGVLAHEVGHWQHAHTWKRIGAGLLGAGIPVGGLYVLLHADWLYGMWNVPALGWVGLLAALPWLGPLGLISRPLMNGYSRFTERQADRYAVRHGLGDALGDALSRLARTNYATVFPDPLYATFHASHPTLPERIRAARRDA